MYNNRSLTAGEIAALESRGCTAADWTRVLVAEDFTPAYISNVAFYGDIVIGSTDGMVEVEEGFARHSAIRNAVLHDVTIGDDCLIENIGCHISHYDIGEGCYIANVGTMTTAEGATFGQGVTVSVLDEAGDGNVCITDALTSQQAALMLLAGDGSEARRRLFDMARSYAAARRPERGNIGYRVKIVNTAEIVNAVIGDDCEVTGAARLGDCTIVSSEESSTFVGAGAICENSVILAGATVTDGAHIDNCFVGEAVHIGRGFSAENSLFFANSYMDNGEAVAAFCGPFSVSHHKSTLLICGQYSFYNAGSATNFSNHAYKLGPIHYGTLARGSKTASGSHILWPARTGAFSVCLGKIQTHPDTSALPFSYVIGAADGQTLLVPGRNLSTVGTWRDIGKWPKRDARPKSDRRSIVNFDWLNPCVTAAVMAGRRRLQEALDSQGPERDFYEVDGCRVKASWLHRGISLYDRALLLSIGAALESHGFRLPEGPEGTGEWCDLSGMPAPRQEIDRLLTAIAAGETDTLAAVEQALAGINSRYGEYKWNYMYAVITGWLDILSPTDDDIAALTDRCRRARREWLDDIRADAEKEFEMGDVSRKTLDDFLKACR